MARKAKMQGVGHFKQLPLRPRTESCKSDGQETTCMLRRYGSSRGRPGRVLPTIHILGTHSLATRSVSDPQCQTCHTWQCIHHASDALISFKFPHVLVAVFDNHRKGCACGASYLIGTDLVATPRSTESWLFHDQITMRGLSMICVA